MAQYLNPTGGSFMRRLHHSTAGSFMGRLPHSTGGSFMGRLLHSTGGNCMGRLLHSTGGSFMERLLHSTGGSFMERLLHSTGGSFMERLLHSTGGSFMERLLHSTGAEEGLSLMLNVEQYEYMPGPHDAAGVKILLHDRNEFPKVHALGQALSAGVHSFMAIKLVSVSTILHDVCQQGSTPSWPSSLFL